MDVYLEIFGYIGTALVILSMLMTNLRTLRIINVCGGIISGIYSAFYGAWAVVVMNICLVSINIFQVIRHDFYRGTVDLIEVTADNPCLAYFLSGFNDKDSVISSQERLYMAYIAGDEVALLGGEEQDGTVYLSLLHTNRKYRDVTVMDGALATLSAKGITAVKKQHP